MIKTKKLENGIVLVTEKNLEMQAASIGVWIGAGSAYETPEISGISHFIEHMFFKGTSSRSYKMIAEDMDNLGAQFNAFTGREYTCFHAKAINSVFLETCDVLFDMMANSLFDSKEMKKELGVILEEMSMVEDTPDDYIIDLLIEDVMSGASVSNSIIGKRKSLKSITRQDILEYIKKQYVRDKIVIAVSGNFDEKKLIQKINESFAGFKATKKSKLVTEFDYKPKYTNKVRDINQSHIALGIPTMSMGADNYYAQAIVNEVLGGSMSSRLFQNIREERGLCYSIYSSPLSFAKNGMLYIYAGVSLGKEKDAIDGIAEELARLSLTEDEIKNVKLRLKAGYIFGLEKLDNRMMRLGKNQLLLGRTYTAEETMREIDAVSYEDVENFCKSISNIKNYSGVSISNSKLDIKELING